MISEKDKTTEKTNRMAPLLLLKYIEFLRRSNSVNLRPRRSTECNADCPTAPTLDEVPIMINPLESSLQSSDFRCLTDKL